MSILIRGIEMPKDGEITLRIDGKGEVYVCGSYPTELHKAFPVRPHGRLIDADASIDVAEGHVSPCQTTIAAFLLNHVEGLAPRVVIPAEEGE